MSSRSFFTPVGSPGVRRAVDRRRRAASPPLPPLRARHIPLHHKLLSALSTQSAAFPSPSTFVVSPVLVACAPMLLFAKPFISFVVVRSLFLSFFINTNNQSTDAVDTGGRRRDARPPNQRRARSRQCPPSAAAPARLLLLERPRIIVEKVERLPRVRSRRRGVR